MRTMSRAASALWKGPTPQPYTTTGFLTNFANRTLRSQPAMAVESSMSGPPPMMTRSEWAMTLSALRSLASTTAGSSGQPSAAVSKQRVC